MRFLCIGDIHIKVENIDSIERLEDQVCAWLEEHRADIDAVVILGDVLHTHERLHVIALNRAYGLFARIVSVSKKPLYILVGNHDFIQNDQFLTTNHWMNAIKQWPKTFISDKVLSFEKNGEFALFCPYVPVGRFEEALDTFPNWRRASVIFAHQEFYGAVMNNGIQSSAGDNWKAENPLVVSGHIHGRQNVGERVHYVGAALPSSDGKSTLSVIDTSLEIIEPLRLVFPRRQILRGLSVDQVRTDYATWNLCDIHGLVVRDSFENFKLFQKEKIFRDLVSRRIKVDFKPIVNETTVAIAEKKNQDSFYDYLATRVVEQENEYLYAALEKALRDNIIEEDNILVVNRKFE